MSAASADSPAVAHTASYRVFSWPIMSGNRVTSAVAAIGVPGQRDPAVPVTPDPAHQPQVGAFLLALPRCAIEALPLAWHERGEVGHVQRHRGAVHPGCLHDPRRDRAGDLLQLLQRHSVHRVPEPAVVQHRSRDLGEPVCGGGLPPVREAGLGARGDQPVQRRQRQVRPRPRARVRPPRPGDLVDDRGHAQVLQHSPGRGHVPERQMPGPLGQHRGLAGIQQRLDVGRRAQVPLRHQLGLAINPAHLAQVQYGFPPTTFLYRLATTLGHRTSGRRKQADTPDHRRPAPIPRRRQPIKIELARKLG